VPEGSEAHPGLSAVEAAGLRRVVAIEFREHITTRGTVPGDALRWVQQILEPTVSWQQVLAASVRRAVAHVGGAVDYTYSRVSRRRAAAPRVVFPGMRRPLPSVAAVVDTSGSVDDGLLAQALAEVEGTLQGLGVAGGSVTVLACDAAVQSVKAVRRAKDAVLGGGGGTDMCAGIEAAVQLRPRPDVVVVLTDGYTPWPAEPPGVAVVGGLLGRDRAMLPPTPDWVMRVECVA
jgi:predicted metal-dependent peptidase